VPIGSPLPREDWAKRHRVVLAILWAHVPLLFEFGVLAGRGVLSTAAETSAVGVAALIAELPFAGRRTRSCAATLGLVGSSALLVHLSGGWPEMHFHFFVVIAIVTLYQDWLAFGLAVGLVMVHQGVLGTLDPKAAYNDPRVIASPWLFAAVHEVFVLGAAAMNIVAWRLYEDVSHPGSADQARQPEAVQRTTPGRAHPARSPGRSVDHAAHRPRPLQGRQRRPGVTPPATTSSSAWPS
jgi:hypothetical protein